jgi:hypothetical protein
VAWARAGSATVDTVSQMGDYNAAAKDRSDCQPGRRKAAVSPNLNAPDMISGIQVPLRLARLRPPKAYVLSASGSACNVYQTTVLDSHRSTNRALSAHPVPIRSRWTPSTHLNAENDWSGRLSHYSSFNGSTTYCLNRQKVSCLHFCRFAGYPIDALTKVSPLICDESSSRILLASTRATSFQKIVKAVLHKATRDSTVYRMCSQTQCYVQSLDVPLIA